LQQYDPSAQAPPAARERPLKSLREDIRVPTKSKAIRAAEIAFACFQKLSPEEQKSRLKAIRKLKLRRNK